MGIGLNHERSEVVPGGDICRGEPIHHWHSVGDQIVAVHHHCAVAGATGCPGEGSKGIPVLGSGMNEGVVVHCPHCNCLWGHASDFNYNGPATAVTGP